MKDMRREALNTAFRTDEEINISIRETDIDISFILMQVRLNRLENLLYSVLHEKSFLTTIYKEPELVAELLAQVKTNEGLGND